MPKVFINYPEGTFSASALDALAGEITTIGRECEKLPDTPYVRSNIWVYAREYGAGKVYHGGNPRGTKVITLEANVVAGALGADSRKELIARLTGPSENMRVFRRKNASPCTLSFVMFRPRAGECSENRLPLILCTILHRMQYPCRQGFVPETKKATTDYSVVAF